MINAFKTLFFSTYLIGDSEAVSIAPFDNSLTLGFGYFLYATFQIGNVTILMSMLIAMMTKSYENIIVSIQLTQINSAVSLILIYFLFINT